MIDDDIIKASCSQLLSSVVVFILAIMSMGGSMSLLSLAVAKSLEAAVAPPPSFSGGGAIV